MAAFAAAISSVTPLPATEIRNNSNDEFAKELDHCAAIP
jgi:hypothetical protein